MGCHKIKHNVGSGDQCDQSSCGHGSVHLNNGIFMPNIGLGTAGFTDQNLVNNVIDAALKSGYRMFGRFTFQFIQVSQKIIL